MSDLSDKIQQLSFAQIDARLQAHQKCIMEAVATIYIRHNEKEPCHCVYCWDMRKSNDDFERNNPGGTIKMTNPDQFLLQVAKDSLAPIEHKFGMGCTWEIPESAVIDFDDYRMIINFLEFWPSGVLPNCVGDFVFTRIGPRKYRITRGTNYD